MEKYRFLAAQRAELAIPIWEAVYPNDKRLREAVETAYAYAQGEADLMDILHAYVDATTAYEEASAASMEGKETPSKAAARYAALAVKWATDPDPRLYKIVEEFVMIANSIIANSLEEKGKEVE